MSFAGDVKLELARLDDGRDCCQKAELHALTLLLARREADGPASCRLSYICDSPATARKIFVILKGCYALKPAVKARERRRFKISRIYLVEIAGLDPDHPLLADMGLVSANPGVQFNPGLVKRKCCRRSFLRGIFLGRGYINRPEGLYHLELILPHSGLVAPVQRILGSFGMRMSFVERKNQAVLYIKDSERIGDFLRLIGASRAVLDFENARIVKYIRNTVNRQVNCETANVNKTIEAAVRQNQLIQRLVDKMGVEGLPDDLRELALLRMEFPDDNLRELGLKMEPPLSKSGIAYRMRKLESYAGQVLLHS